MLQDNDALVLVLVGHGDDTTGSFVVGDEDNEFKRKKEDLEMIVPCIKGNTVFQ
jgi:hypothetical protein